MPHELTDGRLIELSRQAGLCYADCWDFTDHPERLNHLRSFAKLLEPNEPEVLSLKDLEEAWNKDADEYNQWDTLGLDEIVEFAQKMVLFRQRCSTPRPIRKARTTRVWKDREL